MKMFRTALGAVFLCLLAIGLTACGSTDADNAQTRAGIADAELATAVGPDGVPYISAMRLIDGKERGDVTLVIETPAGHKVRYSATDVLAFQGQQFRAELENAIADAWKDATPEVVGKVADSVIAVLRRDVVP